MSQSIDTATQAEPAATEAPQGGQAPAVGAGPHRTEDPILSVVLDEFLFQKDGAPTPADFRELLRKHPENSDDIADFAATWANVAGITEQEVFSQAHAATQPAREPLTEEQIVRIYERPELAGTRHASGTEKAIAVARAIERAHGIGTEGKSS